MNFTVEGANYNHSDFIVDCIVESELSGTKILSYSRIFDISILDVRQLVKEIISNEISVQPWAYENFYILMANNVPLCGLCAWREPAHGNSFDFVKSQVISYLIKEKWMKAEMNLKIASEINITRYPDFLQLEHLYSLPIHRGKGYMSRLILEVEKRFKNDNCSSSQILLMDNNRSAYKLYSRLGYIDDNVRCSTNNEILKLMPGNCRISLIKKI